MQYRQLGRTGLSVSEIGFGAEWMPKKSAEEVRAFVDATEACGINIMDVWMPDPDVRAKLGAALEGRRERWIIQGHIGSTWQDGQYVRTRDIEPVRAAFEDLLRLMRTDYMDLGMIHFVDGVDEFRAIMDGGPYLDYVHELRAAGTIRHLGLSTHNPEVGRLAALSGEIETIMFSANPAFDMMPPSEDINTLFGDFSDAGDDGIDPARAALYAACEQEGVGITVMKPYAGGRLLAAETSPFGVALTPAQCIHYALTRPAVASVMAGFGELSHIDDAMAYETATPAERDYASVLADAPAHAYMGQCTYCGHCAPCPSGIDIASVNKYYDLATMPDAVPPTVRAHYEALDVHADACIACGSCEERCPFGVHVADRMHQAAELFG